jgi:hypothetical protein
MAAGIAVNGKVYTSENTNEYQRIILEMLQRERGKYAQLENSGATKENLLKQQGVIEHYSTLLLEFDGIEAVQHLFEPLLMKK